MIRAKFGVPNSPQSRDIGQNSDKGISDFRSIIKVKVNKSKSIPHNSRTSDDINMKYRTVTNLDKGNKTTSKKFDN